MAEIVISIASKLAEYLVPPAISQGRYLFCGAKITRNLESEKEKLLLTQVSVQQLVQEALNRTEMINKAVEMWLEEVENVLKEVENLEQELKAGGGNGCFRGWYPNWRKYSLSKEMAKKTDVMMRLNTNRDFNPFSSRARLADIEYFSSGNFTYFNSTKLASDELLKALGDDSFHMVGLYGIGGSGKTTLAKEVGKKAKEAKLFDRVIFTTVSQTPNVKRIQREIANLLDLRIDYFFDSDVEVARKISFRLQRGEPILLILDDVWGKLNLENIGIPIDEDSCSFKILLTTRRLQVCTLMDCQKKIPLNLLSEDEAFNLLQKYVGEDDRYFTLLNGLAEGVARECKGLHIAIEAVGTSLKGKSIDEWKVALDRLKHSKPIDVEDGAKDAFACLKLSYDYLKSKEAKLLFLMCSMFPEDYDISDEDLFRYGIGLGLCGEVDSFELARSQVNAGINNLLSSCLLMRSEKKKDHLKMHDVIRDVALWIARKEGLPIHVNLEKDMNTLSNDGAFNECYALSSYYEEIDQLPRGLDSPKLEILILNTSWSLRSSHASFEGTKGLKVMAITAVNYFKAAFLSLPQSTWLLNNLRTLRLVEWHLDDISSVVSLVSLEILDLRGCYVTLPNGIAKLRKLKLLDLSRSHIDNMNCYEVIRRCSQLQELYVFGAYSGLIVTSESFHPNNKLQRYALRIGQGTRWSGKVPWQLSSKRSLYLGELNVLTSDVFVKDLLQRAEDVYLCYHQGGCKSIIPELVQAVGGMNELTKLRLDACSEIECLIDTSSYLFQVDVMFPKLVKLVVENMDNLSEVVRGPVLDCFFENLEELQLTHCSQLHSIFPRECNLCILKVLKIDHCPSLIKSLFPMSVAQTMVLLQELSIKECRELNCLVTDEGEEIISDNSGLLFPKLRVLSIASCQNLEFIFPTSYAQGLEQLQEMSIAKAPEMKYVFGPNGHEGRLSYQNNILLPLLSILRLEGLPKLLSICPENYSSRWPSLTKLHWINCPMFAFSGMNVNINLELRQLHPNMEQRAAEMSENQLSNEVLPPTVLEVKDVDIQNCGVVNIFHLERVGQLMASKLESLRLTNLPELRSIWTGISPTQILTLQYLQHLEVYHCGKLKSVFSSIIYTFSIPMLTNLVISDCEELEEIIAENEEPHNLGNSQICFPKLRELQVLRCNKLKRLFSTAVARMLPQLKYLSVIEAAELLVVFKCKDEDCITSQDEIELPNLRKVKLVKLPNLIEFCQEEILLPTLRMIELIALPRLIQFCQGFRLQSVKLHKVILEGCPKLNSISTQSQVISLPRRREGQQANGTSGSQLCDEVSALLPDDLNIHHLEIKYCSAMNIFYPKGVESVASKLVTLCLSNLPEMRLIWMDCTHFVSLHGLQELSVYNCGKLKSVFSLIFGRSLPQLMHLRIWDCEELEEIIAENDDTQNLLNDQVCFPKLESLRVERCHKLRRLFFTTMVRMLPQLKSLYISNCAQLEEIFGCGNIEDSNISNQKEIVLPNLRQLSLSQLPNLIEICRGFILHAVELNDVDITDCPKFTPILGATSVCQAKEELTDGEVSHEQRPIMVSNLGSLSLELLELAFIWKGPILVSFKLLTCLRVKRCIKLRCIFSSAIIRSLPLLERLHIKECEELEEIISSSEEEAHYFSNPSISCPQQPCFPKLRWLEIEGCNGLRCVFLVSILGDIPCLRSLEIRRCSQLEQVFGCVPQNHDAEMMEFELPNLTVLGLEQLPSLVDICQGFTLHMKKLDNVTIHECPKFAPFLRANQEMSVHQSKEVIRNGEIRNQTQALQAILNVNEGEGALMIVSNLKELNLKHLDEVEYIWMGPTLISFQYLEELRVEGCRKLRCIFSGAVVKSLPLLYELKIIKCEELEEIISLSEEDEEANFPNPSSTAHHLQHPYFPKLKSLKVVGCNRLRCVFPLSISPYHIPSLQSLKIRRCSLVEQVFGCAPQNHHRHDDDAEMMEFQLPKLAYLTLKELPGLTNFCRGFESELKLEALLSGKVKNCPNFSSTSIPALHELISSIQSDDDTDETEEEDSENDIDDNVGETLDNMDDINDEDVDEDEYVNEDHEYNEVEEGEEDDEDEDIDLVGFLDNEDA